MRKRSPDHIDPAHDLTLTGGSAVPSVLRRAALPLFVPPPRQPVEPSGYAPCEKCGTLTKGRHACAPATELAAVVELRRGRRS